MNSKIFFLSIFAFAILQSCSPVLEQNITNLEKIDLEPLKLEPGYDLYSIRLDVIRETETSAGGQGGTQFASYNRLGFHLGNGLFYDLNNNLSILVDKLYEIKENENFEITERVTPQRRNRYTKEGNTYEERYGTFLASTQMTRFERDEEDGSLIIRESLLSKLRIYESEDELLMKYPLGKTAIRWDGKGYEVKQLFGRRNFVQIGKGVDLDGRYYITQRNNRIEIFRNRSFSNKRNLLFTIIQGEDEIIIYNKKNRGFRMIKNGNKIEYLRNRTPQVYYERTR